MKARTAMAAALLVTTLSSCSWDEHVCSDGEYPVKSANGGMGGACVKDGEEPPEQYERYPEGKVPRVLGDKWDVYWDQKQIEGQKALDQQKALVGLRPDPRAVKGWKRVTVGKVGTIAVPKGWTLATSGNMTTLSRDKQKIEIMVERDGAASIYDRAKAIRAIGTETNDPELDVDTAAKWPGSTTARYVQTDRGLKDSDDVVSTEALLVVTKNDALVVVQGSAIDSEIQGTDASRILRSLELGRS